MNTLDRASFMRFRVIRSQGKSSGILVGCLWLLLSAAAVHAAEWKLVWSDEFDKPGLPDPGKWSYEIGFIRNHEAQYYTRERPENARVENGMLVIEARKEPFKNPDFKPPADGQTRPRRGQEIAEYTSASLTTRGKAAWREGRVEVRAKLPKGRGTWPAIWMLGTNINQTGWPGCGEIEYHGMRRFRPGVIQAHVHTGKYNHVQKDREGQSDQDS